MDSKEGNTKNLITPKVGGEEDTSVKAIPNFGDVNGTTTEDKGYYVFGREGQEPYCFGETLSTFNNNSSTVANTTQSKEIQNPAERCEADGGTNEKPFAIAFGESNPSGSIQSNGNTTNAANSFNGNTKAASPLFIFGDNNTLNTNEPNIVPVVNTPVKPFSFGENAASPPPNQSTPIFGNYLNEKCNAKSSGKINAFVGSTPSQPIAKAELVSVPSSSTSLNFDVNSKQKQLIRGEPFNFGYSLQYKPPMTQALKGCGFTNTNLSPLVSGSLFGKPDFTFSRDVSDAGSSTNGNGSIFGNSMNVTSKTSNPCVPFGFSSGGTNVAGVKLLSPSVNPGEPCSYNFNIPVSSQIFVPGPKKSDEEKVVSRRDKHIMNMHFRMGPRRNTSK